MWRNLPRFSIFLFVLGLGAAYAPHAIGISTQDQSSDAAGLYPVPCNRDAGTPGYYILTTNAIVYGNPALGLERSGKLNRFIASKTHRGFAVYVVTEDRLLHNGQVGGDGWGGGSGDAAAENIRTWLTEPPDYPYPVPVTMPNWRYLGIRYLLLIGNPDPAAGDVPMKNLTHLADVPTDYYYSELTGSWTTVAALDPQAEVAVGRIPVYNHSMVDLDRILDKIIKYENTCESHTDWRNNVFLPTSYKNARDSHTILGETAADTLYVNGYASFADALRGDSYFYRLYEDYSFDVDIPVNYGHFPPNDYIEVCKMEQFDELEPIDPNDPSFYCDTVCCTEEADRDDRYRGDFASYFTTMGLWQEHPFGMIAWSAHGWERGTTRVFDADFVPDLPDVRPLFAFQNSCLNGYPDVANGYNGPDEKYNLAYSLLRNGVVCTVAGTRETGSHAYEGARYVEELFINGRLAGDAFVVARAAVNTQRGDLLLFNLYGDPALGIRSFAVPGDPDTDGDGIVDPFDNCPGFANFSQTDADGDQVGDACQAETGVFRGLGAIGLQLPPHPFCTYDVRRDRDVDRLELAVQAIRVFGTFLAVLAMEFSKIDWPCVSDELVDITEITDGWIGGWNFGFGDTVEAVGDFDGDGRDDFIITSAWGFGIIKVAADGHFVLLAGFPWETDGEWFQEPGASFAAVGDFSGINQGAEEILVRTSQGVGLLYFDSAQIQTLAWTDFGTAIPEVSGGWWMLGPGDRIHPKCGDLDGDGYDDVIIRSNWGIGFLKVSALGAFSTIEHLPWETQIGDWVLRPNDRIAGMGNFDPGARKELLLQSNTHLGIVRYVDSVAGLEVLEMVDSPILSDHGAFWNLSPYDQVIGIGHFEDGSALDAFVLRNSWGLAIAARRENGGLYLIDMHGWNTQLGDWTIRRRGAIKGIGDFNGDGIDELVMWEDEAGLALLTVGEAGLTPLATAPAYALLGDWYLYPDNVVLAVGRFRSAVADGILLKSFDR